VNAVGEKVNGCSIEVSIKMVDMRRASVWAHDRIGVYKKEYAMVARIAGKIG